MGEPFHVCFSSLILDLCLWKEKFDSLSGLLDCLYVYKRRNRSALEEAVEAHCELVLVFEALHIL